MAVSAKLYGNAILKAFNKEIDFEADTIKCMLCTNSYTPDQDTHDYKADITNEVSGTGYTAGGATLGTKAASYTAGTNVAKFDAADVSWSSSTITARYAVLYVDTGSPSTSALIGYVDFGQDISTSNGTFQVIWDSDGIFTITVA